MKLWFSLEMVDSACTSWWYEEVWSRMHEKRERTCPVYQKVPFVPPFFAEREKSPQNILRNPRTRLLLPLVRTLHLSCRRRGRFVPLPETVFQYGRKSKYDWTTGFTILSTCLVNREIVLILEESSEYRRYFLHTLNITFYDIFIS